jgi:hypothetical protein
VTRNSESKTTLKKNSLDLLFWIFWCTEQEHTFIVSHRKSQEHELSAHILFKCLPFSLLNLKAFKAQVCPHFSNIAHQTHGRHGHFELSVCMVRQLDYYVTICWWRAFLWQIFTGICWIVLISLLFSDVESLGIVTSNAPKLMLRPENRDLYILIYITYNHNLC